MGCAFSSTRIVVQTNSSYNGLLRAFLLQVRQGIRPSKNGTVGTASYWLTSTKSGNDAVLVGQLKSNGAYSHRRPSSEARFIEHRIRFSTGNYFSIGIENRMPYADMDSPSKKRSNRDLISSRKDSQQQKACNGSGQVYYGLIDFQKRLERLKMRRQEKEDVIDECGEKQMAHNGQPSDNLNLTTKWVPPMIRVPVEPLIVNHLSGVGEIEQLTVDTFIDGEVWREWDEMSADCCSILVGPPQSQQPNTNWHWHDGEVSEASFVVVKKRLKVAWEHQAHRQFQQMCNLECVLVEKPNQLEAKKNNWIPEIVNEDGLN